jgi:hypothetical protein
MNQAYWLQTADFYKQTLNYPGELYESNFNFV